jgi:hypothetical protein
MYSTVEILPSFLSFCQGRDNPGERWEQAPEQFGSTGDCPTAGDVHSTRQTPSDVPNLPGASAADAPPLPVRTLHTDKRARQERATPTHFPPNIRHNSTVSRRSRRY